jgi:Amidohydrolase family
VKLVPRRVPAAAAREEAALKASLSRAVLATPGLPRFPTALSGAVDLLRRFFAGAAAGPSASPVPASVRAGGPAGLPVLVRVESRSQAERALEAVRAGGRPPVLVAGRSLDARAIDLLAPECPVVLGPFDLSDPARLLRAASRLEASGATLAFAGGSDRVDLLTSAVLSMRHGLSRAGALGGLTEGPARIYGLEGKLGRIAPGADADLVLWAGDPFTLAARVELVLIDGEPVYRAAAAPKGEKGEVVE